jgi:hypothetical protein
MTTTWDCPKCRREYGVNEGCLGCRADRLNGRIAEMEAERETLKSQVSRLKSALWDACGTIEWMSGSPDFGPEGKAHVGWVKAQPDINRYHTLAVSGEDKRPAGDKNIDPHGSWRSFNGG